MSISKQEAEEGRPDKRDQLIKIARLYYLEEMNQKDIAKKMNMSLASVSRCINRAKVLGIVTISIADCANTFHETEIALEKKFDLLECLLVPASDSLEVIYTDMGKKLSGLLERLLSPQAILGVSWGDTLRTMADSLPVTGFHCGGVVPIVGAVGRIETGIYPNRIASSFARKLHSHAYLVNTPGLVDSAETKTLLTGDTSFQDIASTWQKVSVILFSISSLRKGTSLTGGDIFSPLLWSEAACAGATTTTNFNFINDLGEEVPTELSNRIINLDYEQMKGKRHRILASSGEEKIRPMLAALRGGLPTVLITDFQTGQALLQQA
jgi:DNA-binding transcriptional regulator LsrR (DeoR family)